MILGYFQSLKKTQRILGWMSGGIYKRIDENRELLELLRDEAPGLIEKHPEVVHWLQAHDDFFMQFAEELPPKEVQFDLRRPVKGGSDRGFPRPWPFEFANDIRRRTILTADGKLALKPDQA